MSITANSEFNLECIAWVDYLADKYDVHVTAADLSIILTKLDRGTHLDYEVTMRYINSQERDSNMRYQSILNAERNVHRANVNTIELDAKRQRRALDDKRGRIKADLRMSLSQCTTDLERSAVYAAYDNRIADNSHLMDDTYAAENKRKAEEMERYTHAVDVVNDNYKNWQNHWRQWKDATDRIFALGLVLPLEED